MIIVDASTLANALTDDGSVGMVSRFELARDAHWAAPQHLLVETFSAIRSRQLDGKVSASRCRDALGALGSAAIDMVSTQALLPRMWELRSNVSGYDAAYVAGRREPRLPAAHQ